MTTKQYSWFKIDCPICGNGLREVPKQEQDKEWAGLTDEQIVDLVIKHAGFPTKLAEAIEAKLKEKNT